MVKKYINPDLGKCGDDQIVLRGIANGEGLFSRNKGFTTTISTYSTDGALVR
jgi:hypothetical protein